MKTQLKRILSVLLSMTLVWNLLPMQALATETDSAFVTRGTYSYQQITNHRVVNSGAFVFRDDCFMRSSYLGCNHLLELSAELAQAAVTYFDADDDYGQDVSQCNKNVLGFFEAAGFKDGETNAYYTRMDEENSMSVAVAHREIDEFGKNYTLLAIAPKGAEYRQEWAGNFNVGTAMMHEGFKAARDEVLRFTKSYIQKHGISGDLKVWISGYSRSAAVANLLGGFFADGGDDYFDDVTVEPENVYCYTFATPRSLIVDPKTGQGLDRSKELSVAPNRPNYPYDTPMASYDSSASGQVMPTAATFDGIRNYVATGDLFAMLPPAAWGYTVYGTTFTTGEDVHTGAVVTDEARMAQKLEGINKNMYDQFMNQGNESGFSWLSFDLASLALVTTQAPAGIEKTQQAFLRERVKGLKKVADDPDVFYDSGMSRAMSAALANYGFYVIYSRGATGAEQLQASKLIKPVLSTYFAYASERIIEESAAAGKALSEDEAAVIALADLITYVTGTPINAETSTTDDVMAALFKYLYDNKDSTLVTTLLGALDNLSDTNKTLVRALLDRYCAADDPSIEQVVISYVRACAYGPEEGSAAYEDGVRTPKEVRASSIYTALSNIAFLLNLPIDITELLGEDLQGDVVLKDVAGTLTKVLKSYKDESGEWHSYDTLGDAADAFLRELADAVLGQAITQCREQGIYTEEYLAAWQHQLDTLKRDISSVRRCLSHFLFYSEGEPFSTGSIVRNVATLAGNGNRLITTHALEIYTAWAQAVNAAENEESDHFIRHVEGTPATVEGTGPYDCLEVHDVDGVDYYVSVSARKDWVDFDTTTRKDVTFELMRSVDGGAPVRAGVEDKTISADKTSAEDRRVTWNWLPREDESGRRYVYSVVEKDGVVGYAAAPAKVLDDGTVVIANVEDVEVKVAVKWDDAADAEGLRPDAITVSLVDETGKVLTNVDGKECELVLLASTGWQGSFEKVPLVDEAGRSINCRPEVSVDGYTTDVTGTAKDGFTVTLHHSPMTSLTVTKEWVGRIEGPVTVILTANGADANMEPRTIAGNGSVTFDNLPAFDTDGKPIHYSAREVEGVYPNVKVTYPTPVDSRHMTIVNTNESKKTISGNIYWVGDRNVSLMSEPVNQTVATNVAPETQQPVSDVVESTPTDTGAVVTDATGQQVGATGETEGVVAGDAHDPSVTVPGNEVVNGTESEEPGNVGDSQNEGVVAAVASALVRTAYADDLSGMVVQAAPSVRPTSVKLTLYANGEAIDAMTVSDPTGDRDVWPYSFGERPEFDDKGTEIVYQVVEGNVENYLKSGPGTSANTFDITNTYKPGSTSVTALVAWQDDADKDGKRPDTIRVQLYANGVPGDARTLSAANSWTETFEGLPAKDAYGNPITYTVRMVDAPANYRLDTTGDASSAFVFVERYENEKVTVAGKVIWSDSDNAKGSRPSSVTVNLLVGNKVVESKKVTGSGNEWPFAFTGLDAYEDGKLITYTVGAGEVSGYTSSVTGSMAGGFNVTYTIKSGGGTDPEPVEPSGHYDPFGLGSSWLRYPPTFGGRRNYGSSYAPTTTTTTTTTSTNSGTSYTNVPANSGYTIPSNTTFSSTTTPTITTSPVVAVTQAPAEVSAATPAAAVTEGEGLAVTADATEILWIYVLGMIGAAILVVSRRLRA